MPAYWPLQKLFRGTTEINIVIYFVFAIKDLILMRVSFIKPPEADDRLSDNNSKITHCISSQFDSNYSLISFDTPVCQEFESRLSMAPSNNPF